MINWNLKKVATDFLLELSIYYTNVLIMIDWLNPTWTFIMIIMLNPKVSFLSFHLLSRSYHRAFYEVFRLPKTLFIQVFVFIHPGVCFYCTGSLLVGAIPPTNSEPVQ